MERNKVVALLNTPSSGLRPPSPSRGEVNSVRGFTLIELLVVVLIIGILAAVAVPQYQKAVAKSRITAMIPLITAIANAEEAYYVATGGYTHHISNLDIDVSGQCSLYSSSTTDDYYFCGNHFVLNLTSSANITLSYCNIKAENKNECLSKRDLRITRIPKYAANNSGKSLCVPAADSQIGHKICNSLTGFELYE